MPYCLHPAGTLMFRWRSLVSCFGPLRQIRHPEGPPTESAARRGRKRGDAESLRLHWAPSAGGFRKRMRVTPREGGCLCAPPTSTRLSFEIIRHRLVAPFSIRVFIFACCSSLFDSTIHLLFDFVFSFILISHYAYFRVKSNSSVPCAKRDPSRSC